MGFDFPGYFWLDFARNKVDFRSLLCCETTKTQAAQPCSVASQITWRLKYPIDLFSERIYQIPSFQYNQVSLVKPHIPVKGQQAVFDPNLVLQIKFSASDPSSNL